MQELSSLLTGFSIALTTSNLLWCIIGCFLGTVIGILPGIGPAATIALLLPLTLKLNPTTGMIMMAGIYYGSKYGGSLTSILFNVPGETASVVTCLDGYQMARKGRAGAALGIAAISSFVAGTFGVLGLMLLAPVLATWAIRFGPPEYFAVMVFGLTMVVFLSGKSMIKGFLSTLFGLWLATMGIDLFTAQSRFTFGLTEMLDGIDFTVVCIGLFAIGEILQSMEQQASTQVFGVPKGLRNLLPNLQDLKDCRFAFLNGSVIGFLCGVIPGGGATMASFVSYGIEKAFSRHPEKFGTGAIEGVAAPEGANNSECGGALVPLMTLGIPGTATTALLLVALIIWGFKPGPLLIQENPNLFWGLVASMYIGNVILLIMNLPLVPLFAQIMRIPYYLLYPAIIGLSIVGVYSSNNSLFDVWVMGLFGLLGYIMRKLDFPAASLLLGMVLGRPLEHALRQSLILSNGSMGIFITRPIGAVILFMSALVLLMPLTKAIRSWRVKALDESAL